MSGQQILENQLGLRVGDHLIYFSPTQNKCLETKVIAMRENGDIQIDAKKGHWIPIAEQKEKIKQFSRDSAPSSEKRSEPRVKLPVQGVDSSGTAVAHQFAPPRRHVQADQANFGCVAECSNSHCLEFSKELEVGWTCAGSRAIRGCKMCINQPVTSPGLQRFRCSEGCDYSLCSECAQRRTVVPPAEMLIRPPAQAVLEPKSGGDSPAKAAADDCPDVEPADDWSWIDPNDQLENLPKEILHVGHEHQLRLKTVDDVNHFNIVKRFQGGNRCSVKDCPNPDGHLNYYRCSICKTCPFYCCLKCAEHAVPVHNRLCSEESSDAGPSTRKALSSLNQREMEFYRMLQNIINDGQTHADKELCVEVLEVMGMQDFHGLRGYRFGDKTKGVFRSLFGTEATFCPYVKVRLNGAESLTTVVEEVRERAEFNKQFTFPLPESVRLRRSLAGNALQVTVYDSRGETLMSHPIIGEARVELLDDDLNDAREFTEPLLRGEQEGAQIRLKVGGLREAEMTTEAPAASGQQVTAETVFKRYDANQDNRLDHEEMRNVLRYVYKNLSLEEPGEDFLNEVFERAGFDDDEDGSVDCEEFPQLFKWICARCLANLNFMGADNLRRKAKGYFTSKYELGKRLAAGVGGVAYLADQRASGTTVVVKKPKIAKDIEDFELLKDKFHPNIVRVFELFTSDTDTYVVMECCGGGDLFSTVRYCQAQFGGLTRKFAASMMKQSMQGINYLAKRFEECHNDIKPENVLVECKPVNLQDLPRCMIADFGCVGKADVLKSGGDPRYQAPELWSFEKGKPPPGKPSFASDVWSLGVMLFELLSGGYLPFVSHMNLSNWAAFISYGTKSHGKRVLLARLMDSIAKQEGPKWAEIESAGDLALDLCKGMLAWDRRKRPSLEFAMQHPFFDVLVTQAEPLPANLREILERRSQLTTLKMALLNFVASRLQGTRLRRYAEMFEKFDDNGDGVLSREEFAQTLTRECGFPQARSTAIFDLAHIGVDGPCMDFNEFVALTFDPGLFEDKQLESFLKGVFDDIAENEKIHLNTFSELFPKSQAPEVIRQIFVEMDTLNSGWVSWKEFKKYAESF